MNNAMTVLELLSDGQPRTVRALVEATGFSLLQVQNAMRVLRNHEALRTLDLPYVVTEAGLQRLAHLQKRRTQIEANKEAEAVARQKPTRIGRPPLPMEVKEARAIERSREKGRKRREIARLERAIRNQQAGRVAGVIPDMAVIQVVVPAPATRDSLLESAVANRPPLQAVWGSSHA